MNDVQITTANVAESTHHDADETVVERRELQGLDDGKEEHFVLIGRILER